MQQWLKDEREVKLKAMTDQIFSPAFGNRPRTLVGRNDLLNTIIQGLGERPGSRERAVLLLGQRGYGKTVLLLELADAARKEGFVVASPTVVSSEMQDRILEKIRIAGEPFLKAEKRPVTGGGIGMLGFNASIQFGALPDQKKSFTQQLSELCGMLNNAGKGVLILVDELIANREELRQLIIAYQELVGEEKNIAMIMAGLPSSVASTLNDHVLTFLNRARKITLGPLRISEIALYYQQAFRQQGVILSDDRVRQAAERTEGSPYLMQLIGHYVTLKALPGCEVTEDEMSDAVEMAREDFQNDICQTSIHPLSDKDVAFLKAMTLTAGSEVEIGDIQQRLAVSSAYVQNYKRRLIQSGVIETVGRGKVRYTIPFMREYLLNM